MVWSKIPNLDTTKDYIYYFQNRSKIATSYVHISITENATYDENSAFLLQGRQYLRIRVPAGTNVFYAEEDGGIFIFSKAEIEKLVNYDIPTTGERVIMGTVNGTKMLTAPEGAYIALQNVSDFEYEIKYTIGGAGPFALTQHQMVTFSFTKDTEIKVTSTESQAKLSYVIAQSPNVTQLSDENKQKLEDILHEIRLVQESMARKEEVEFVEDRSYMDKWSDAYTYSKNLTKKVDMGTYAPDVDYRSANLDATDVLYAVTYMTFSYYDDTVTGNKAQTFAKENEGITWDYPKNADLSRVDDDDRVTASQTDYVNYPGWSHDDAEIYVYPNVSESEYKYQGSIKNDTATIETTFYYTADNEVIISSVNTTNMYVREYLSDVAFYINSTQQQTKMEYSFSKNFKEVTAKTRIRADEHKFKQVAAVTTFDNTFSTSVDLYNNEIFFTDDTDYTEYLESNWNYPLTVREVSITQVQNTIEYEKTEDDTLGIEKHVFKSTSDGVEITFNIPTSDSSEACTIKITCSSSGTVGSLSKPYGMSFIPNYALDTDTDGDELYTIKNSSKKRFSLDFVSLADGEVTFTKTDDNSVAQITVPVYYHSISGYNYFKNYITDLFSSVTTEYECTYDDDGNITSSTMKKPQTLDDYYIVLYI